MDIYSTRAQLAAIEQQPREYSFLYDLTDSARAVLAQAEESIAGSNTDTGVYYRFRVSVTEGE